MAFQFFNIIFDGLLSGLLLSFLLGLLHGITPDEHTWPITFSYAIGSYSTKKGAEVGLIFSSGFTLQRAIMSEIFYLIFNDALGGISNIVESAAFFALVYILVSFFMAIAGYYIKYGRWVPHLNFDRFIGKGLNNRFKHESEDFYAKNVSPWMALVHGLIAGFGMGAFALITFTVIAPNMPNAYLGFMPGLFYGLGTMAMQIIFGATFGASMLKIKKLTSRGLEFLAHFMSSYVLLYGGIVFMLAGISSFVFPVLLNAGVSTGIPVYNLNSFNLGFVLVIITVGIIGLAAYLKGIKIAKSIKNGKRAPF